MDVYFVNSKLGKIFNSERNLRKKYGPISDKIKQRLAELRAASTLSEVSQYPPARCHELKENHKGQFAVNVSENKRLIFVPHNHPTPLKVDGGIDLTKVTEICIIDVLNYHQT